MISSVVLLFQIQNSIPSKLVQGSSGARLLRHHGSGETRSLGRLQQHASQEFICQNQHTSSVKLLCRNLALNLSVSIVLSFDSESEPYSVNVIEHNDVSGFSLSFCQSGVNFPSRKTKKDDKKKGRKAASDSKSRCHRLITVRKSRAPNNP